MAGGGGSVLARGEEEAAFIAGRKAVGRYLHIKAARGRGTGRSVAGVRRKGAATWGRPSANDGTWASRRGRCASGM
jgi:hypothetical protein